MTLYYVLHTCLCVSSFMCVQFYRILGAFDMAIQLGNIIMPVDVSSLCKSGRMTIAISEQKYVLKKIGGVR